MAGIRQRPRGERLLDDLSGPPRPGLQKYLSRFDDAMKLRGQLANEKPVQDGGSDPDELDPFKVFRLFGSVLLAVFVRLFVCKYLVSLPTVGTVSCDDSSLLFLLVTLTTVTHRPMKDHSRV